MVHIAIPADLARHITDRAVQNCRQDLSGRGWKSSRALAPKTGEGLVGIQTSARYLMFQEQGIRPFLMRWVEGRTLPLGCSQGDGPHFRKGSHVGEPGYVTLPHGGKVWRQARWRHPGIRANRFMQSAIKKGIEESKTEIRQEVMRALRGEL